MSEFHDQLIGFLRRGDAQSALVTAQKWIQIGEAPVRETAIEIAKAVGQVYRDLISDPVHEFIGLAEQKLGPEAGGLVGKAVGRLIKMTEQWEPRLRSCYEERMARELRDFVRSKNWNEALGNVEALCRPVRGGDDELRQRALYVGNVLGTCLNHPKEADHLLKLVAKDPEAYGVTHRLVSEMQEAKDDRHSRMMATQVDNIENQWTQTLRSTQVDIMQLMPPRNEMGDPSEENLRDVGDIFRSILRVPIMKRETDLLVDATLLLVDFTPKELAYAAAASGVEGRSYTELGFRARKTIALVFSSLGENPFFTQLYGQWAEDQLETRYAGQVIEFMGAIRCDDYAPFLADLWQRRSYKHLRSELATALANLASPESADLMLNELKTLTTKRVIDPAAMREAERLLAGLGRIVRSPRTDDKVRRHIVSKTLSMMPRDNIKLSNEAVMQVLSARPDVLSDAQRRWAIDRLVDALWVPDQSTEMTRGEDRADNFLGARNPIMKALKNIGTQDPDHLYAGLERQSARYSGAMMAAAEILEEIHDPRSVQVLQKMLLTASMHDEERELPTQKETYWDPAEQRRKPLTKQMVTSSLVESLGHIGTPDAKKALQNLQQQVQMGRVKSFGKQAEELLVKTVGAPMGTASEHAGSDAPDEQSESRKPEKADPDEVKKLIKAISASHFFKGSAKRAQAKIMALVRLAQIKSVDALDAIAKNLADKDPMVASAAISALADYGGPGQPGYMVELVMEKVFEALEHKDPAMRQSATKLLRELGPNRPEIRRRVVEYAKTIDDQKIKLRLKMAMEDTTGSPVDENGRVVQLPDEEKEEAQDYQKSLQAASERRDLDLKREYFERRRAWIAGGKEGPPPQPPPGT
ncbi:hypothetical protein KQI84_17395 [bacterium]|nr:hypothetical protein [bacterium]